MWKKGHPLGIVLFISFFVSTVWAQNQIYSWLDEQGGVHFVDSLDLVPVTHRKEASTRAENGVMIEDDSGGSLNIFPQPADSTAETTFPTDIGSHPSGAGLPSGLARGASKTRALGDDSTTVPDLQDKAYWQARIQENVERKASAQAEIEQINADLLRVRTLTPSNFQSQMIELTERQEALRVEITAAELELSDVIPTEARRAGVPPGWLR